MSVLRILARNAAFLSVGFLSAIAVLVAMRASAGEPWLQPQSDVGIPIGAALVTIFVVVRDIVSRDSRFSNGNHNS